VPWRGQGVVQPTAPARRPVPRDRVAGRRRAPDWRPAPPDGWGNAFEAIFIGSRTFSAGRREFEAAYPNMRLEFNEFSAGHAIAAPFTVMQFTTRGSGISLFCAGGRRRQRRRCDAEGFLSARPQPIDGVLWGNKTVPARGDWAGTRDRSMA